MRSSFIARRKVSFFPALGLALVAACSANVSDDPDDPGPGDPGGSGGSGGSSSSGSRTGGARGGGSTGTTTTLPDGAVVGGGSGGSTGGGGSTGTPARDASVSTGGSTGSSDARPPADAGSPVSFDAPPGPNVPVGSIPVIYLDVPGRTPDTLPSPNSDKAGGTIRIIEDHDGTHMGLSARPVAFMSAVGVGKRGSSSSGFPQKSFSIELRDAMGLEVDRSVLGLPPGGDWAAVACWTDKPCMRNMLAYAIGQGFGRWNPRGRFVEVIFNGSYQGIYQFLESPHKGKYRVNIPKPAPDMTGGDAFTGGYIVRREAGGKGTSTLGGKSYPRDWLSPTTAPGMWAHQMVYTYGYPNEADITAAQKTYIRDHMAKFEEAMKAADWAQSYRSWIDVQSWADNIIINELTNNVDGYWKSLRFAKLADQAGVRGKLLATPIWDFNLGFGNADYRNGWRTDVINFRVLVDFGGECTGYVPKAPPVCAVGCCTNTCPAGQKCWNMPIVPFYFERVQGDAGFRNDMKCRWRELRKAGGPLDMAVIDGWIADWKRQLEKYAVPRHFNKWPALRMYVWPNPYNRDPSSAPVAGASVQDFFTKEVTWLRNWVDRRIRYLDTNLPGTCNQ